MTCTMNMMVLPVAAARLHAPFPGKQRGGMTAACNGLHDIHLKVRSERVLPNPQRRLREKEALLEPGVFLERFQGSVGPPPDGGAATGAGASSCTHPQRQHSRL